MGLTTGETVQVRSIMYKSFIQFLFLYDSEIFVVMGSMLKVLDGFHH